MNKLLLALCIVLALTPVFAKVSVAKKRNLNPDDATDLVDSPVSADPPQDGATEELQQQENAIDSELEELEARVADGEKCARELEENKAKLQYLREQHGIVDKDKQEEELRAELNAQELSLSKVDTMTRSLKAKVHSLDRATEQIKHKISATKDTLQATAVEDEVQAEDEEEEAEEEQAAVDGESGDDTEPVVDDDGEVKVDKDGDVETEEVPDEAQEIERDIRGDLGRIHEDMRKTVDEGAKNVYSAIDGHLTKEEEDAKAEAERAALAAEGEGEGSDEADDGALAANSGDNNNDDNDFRFKEAVSVEDRLRALEEQNSRILAENARLRRQVSLLKKLR